MQPLKQGKDNTLAYTISHITIVLIVVIIIIIIIIIITQVNLLATTHTSTLLSPTAHVFGCPGAGCQLWPGLQPLPGAHEPRHGSGVHRDAAQQPADVVGEPGGHGCP